MAALPDTGLGWPLSDAADFGLPLTLNDLELILGDVFETWLVVEGVTLPGTTALCAEVNFPVCDLGSIVICFATLQIEQLKSLRSCMHSMKPDASFAGWLKGSL